MRFILIQLAAVICSVSLFAKGAEDYSGYQGFYHLAAQQAAHCPMSLEIRASNALSLEIYGDGKWMDAFREINSPVSVQTTLIQHIRSQTIAFQQNSNTVVLQNKGKACGAWEVFCKISPMEVESSMKFSAQGKVLDYQVRFHSENCRYIRQ